MKLYFVLIRNANWKPGVARRLQEWSLHHCKLVNPLSYLHVLRALVPRLHGQIIHQYRPRLYAYISHTLKIPHGCLPFYQLSDHFS